MKNKKLKEEEFTEDELNEDESLFDLEEGIEDEI